VSGCPGALKIEAPGDAVNIQDFPREKKSGSDTGSERVFVYFPEIHTSRSDKFVSFPFGDSVDMTVLEGKNPFVDILIVPLTDRLFLKVESGRYGVYQCFRKRKFGIFDQCVWRGRFEF